MELTYKQQEGYDKLLKWYNHFTTPTFVIDGVAGSGKTTMVTQVLKDLNAEKIQIMAYTGRATRVAQSKLGNILGKQIECTTIHSYLYKALTDPNGNIISWRKKPEHELIRDLLIVDEASMVPNSIIKDLIELGHPIIFLGDSMQLPPISGESYILQHPDVVFEEILRSQVSDILRAADLARRKKYVPLGGDGTGAFTHIKLSSKQAIVRLIAKYVKKDINYACITDTNRTRVIMNNAVGKQLGLPTKDLLPTHTVVCTKNVHNISPKIYNGDIGTVVKSEKLNAYYYDATIMFNKTSINRPIPWHGFGYRKKKDGFYNIKESLYLDYGYALTVHKMQGGEADNIIIVGNGDCFKERHRWLYTAITRAVNKVIWVEEVK